MHKQFPTFGHTVSILVVNAECDNVVIAHSKRCFDQSPKFFLDEQIRRLTMQEEHRSMSSPMSGNALKLAENPRAAEMHIHANRVHMAQTSYLKSTSCCLVIRGGCKP